MGGAPPGSHLAVRHRFFFNDSATPEIYALSLHDALPIFAGGGIGLILLPDHRGAAPRSHDLGTLPNAAIAAVFGQDDRLTSCLVQDQILLATPTKAGPIDVADLCTDLP